MTIPELVKVMREYYSAAMAEGFTAAEAMTLTQHYQQQKIQMDMLERMQEKTDKPWERR